MLLVAEVPILLVELIAYVFLLKEYSGSAGGLRRLRQYRQLCRGLSSSPLGGGISGPVRRFVLHGRQNTV